MNYDFIAIPDADVPQAVEPVFQHVVTTYASEANKTASIWRAVPDDLLDFKPQEKRNPIRTIMVHQLLSERRFFAQFVGTQEPPVEELLPSGEKPAMVNRPRLPSKRRATPAQRVRSVDASVNLRRENTRHTRAEHFRSLIERTRPMQKLR